MKRFLRVRPRACVLLGKITPTLVHSKSAGGFIGSATGFVLRGDPLEGRHGAGRTRGVYRCRVVPKTLRSTA